MMTIKTFKDCLTQIENILYIDDKLSILELKHFGIIDGDGQG